MSCRKCGNILNRDKLICEKCGAPNKREKIDNFCQTFDPKEDGICYFLTKITGEGYKDCIVHTGQKDLWETIFCPYKEEINAGVKKIEENKKKWKKLYGE